MSLKPETPKTQDRLAAWMAALCWALAAGGAALWWLHAPTTGASQPASASTAPAPAPVQAAAVLRALGQTHTAASEPVADAAGRFQLWGVVAGHSGQGAALLAVDGQPAQAYVQGQEVGEGWRVESVNAQGVRLKAAGVAPLELAMPSR